MRLFSGPLSMFGAKTQIAAAEKGLDFELVMVPFEMKRLYEPKHPDVRSHQSQAAGAGPHARRSGDYSHSTQIFEHFEDLQPHPALWPARRTARAQARLLEHKSDEVYFPHIIRLMGLQGKAQDPAAVSAREGVQRAIITEVDRLLADLASISPDPTPTPTLPSTWRSCSATVWAAPIPDIRWRMLLRWRASMTGQAGVRVTSLDADGGLSRARRGGGFLAFLSSSHRPAVTGAL